MRNAGADPRRKFADGFPNLFVKDAVHIRNRHVAFLASFQARDCHSSGAIDWQHHKDELLNRRILK